jgi:hypothetical protein
LPRQAAIPILRNLRRAVARVVAAFGAQWVFQRSDITRMNCPYPKVVEQFTKQLDFL